MQVKKWDQNFSLFVVKFKKLGFSAPLTIYLNASKISKFLHL